MTDAADPKTVFRGWPSHRAPPSAAPILGTASALEASRGDGHAGCTGLGCKRHRRDEDWYAEWRRRKCRHLLAASTPPHTAFPSL
jgi:hypothetical protein